MKTLSIVLLLSFSVVTNVFAKKTKEQRRAEREARKKTYGIDKGSRKWTCKKGKGSQTKADCKASLRSVCPTSDGWKMSGSSCKKKKGYTIKKGKSKWRCKKKKDGEFKSKEECKSQLKSICPTSDGWKMSGSKCKKGKMYTIKKGKSKWRCKKSKSGKHKSKDACKTELTKQCASKKNDGWEMKGSKCRKGKMYDIKTNSKGTKMSCKKSSSGKYKSKEDCKAELEKQCKTKASEGFTMKGSKCRKGKSYTIRENPNKTKMKCAKARSSDTGATYNSKEDCKAELEKQCKAKASEGFKMKGSRCRKGKSYTIRENPNKTKMKCAKARSSDTGATYNSIEDCKAELEKQCKAKAKEGFTFKGRICVRGKRFEIATVKKGFMCKKVRNESADKTYFNNKQDCITALTKKCGLKENKDKGYTMKGRKCTEGSGFMNKVGNFIQEQAGGAVGAIKEHGGAAVVFVKNQANQKKLEACKKKLDQITSVNIELLKASAEDPDEKTLFKTMNLTRVQLKKTLNYITVNSYKEDESEVNVTELSKAPVSGCESGCVAKVKNFMTAAPNNSCDHIQSNDSE